MAKSNLKVYSPKRGPKEELHKIDVPFGQALDAILRAKPPARQPKKKRKPKTK